MGTLRWNPDIMNSRRLRGICGIDGVSDKNVLRKYAFNNKGLSRR